MSTFITLRDFFISAPLSALCTLLLGSSMTLVFDYLGKYLFGERQLWARSLYFFSGLLIVSWLIFLLSTIGLISILVCNIIACSFMVGAAAIAYSTGAQHFMLFIKWPKAKSKTSRLLIYLIMYLVVCFVFISLAPPTDDDSLDYHLGLPVDILRRGDLSFNKDFLHFRLFGFGEMINLFGLANGCSQLGAFIQVVAFLWLIFVYTESLSEETRVVSLLLLLGIPSLLFLLPSQKHQLTGICCTSICFYVVSQHSNQLKGHISTVVMLSLLFAIGLKYSFLISAFSIVFLMVLKKPRFSLKWTTWYLIGGAIFLGPLLAYKFVHLGDPLSPLLEFLKTSPDSTILSFQEMLKNFTESTFPFPMNLLLPSSFGNFSTVLGIGFILIVLSPFFMRGFKAEVLGSFLFILLVTLGGQRTSRFFIEPFVWLLPLIVKNMYVGPTKRYLAGLARVQFLSILPFWFYASSIFLPAILCDEWREKLLLACASGYAETKWVDKIVPASAQIATTIRARALLPRSCFPFEYLLQNNPANFDSLNRMMKDYGVQYLVISSEGHYFQIKEKFANGLVAGPKTFFKATRNPFNRKPYELSIYRVK